MELMTLSLLCVILLPSVLGKITLKTDWHTNNSVQNKYKPTGHKKLLLNNNGVPLVKVVNDMQTVFNDVACLKCVNCMERAVKANTASQHVINIRPNVEDLEKDVLSNLSKRDTRRIKRNVDNNTVTEKIKKLKIKSKKSKKSVFVTKYDIDNKVYALRIRESNAEPGEGGNKLLTTCQVYSVKKAFPCESPEANLILAFRRRKTKKIKKVKEKSNKTETAKATGGLFRKRQVDISEGPENFMTSLEELY